MKTCELCESICRDDLRQCECGSFVFVPGTPGEAPAATATFLTSTGDVSPKAEDSRSQGRRIMVLVVFVFACGCFLTLLSYILADVHGWGWFLIFKGPIAAGAACFLYGLRLFNQVDEFLNPREEVAHLRRIAKRNAVTGAALVIAGNVAAIVTWQFARQLGEVGRRTVLANLIVGSGIAVVVIGLILFVKVWNDWNNAGIVARTKF